MSLLLAIVQTPFRRFVSRHSTQVLQKCYLGQSAVRHDSGQDGTVNVAVHVSGQDGTGAVSAWQDDAVGTVSGQDGTIAVSGQDGITVVDSSSSQGGGISIFESPTTIITTAKPTIYEMQFRNLTKDPHYFAIYQRFPNSPRLKSVAWKVLGLPPDGVGYTKWAMNYGVLIANWQHAIPGIFGEQQTVPAELGNSYKITYATGTNIPTIDSNASTITDIKSKSIIRVTNTIPVEMTVGFALDGHVVAVEENIIKGKLSEFAVHPTYFVATYNSIEKGTLLVDDEGVQLLPVEIKYGSGYTNMMVEAIHGGGKSRLQFYPIS